MPDAKNPADPAPDGFLRICWASSFAPYVKQVGEAPMAKKAKRTRKAK